MHVSSYRYIHVEPLFNFGYFIYIEESQKGRSFNLIRCDILIKYKYELQNDITLVRVFQKRLYQRHCLANCE